MDPIERNDKQRFDHEGISDHISYIEDLYSKSEIQIHGGHQLFSLLSSARDVASEWARGNVEETNMNKFFCTLHVERIYSAVRLLESENNKDKYLRDLLNGSLNFFDRSISHAKSILWELEAFAKIKKVIPDTALDEPDVVVKLNQLNIGLSCKKIFSEKGVPKVLSNAVSQIEKRHEFGIVAMNIDDMIPDSVLLKASTFDEAGDKLHARNLDFLARHERHFNKYFMSSRIVGVLVSTSMITDILEESPKFNNFSQWAIWTVPDLKPEHAEAVNEFRHRIIG
ncbi:MULTISPECIES: hypothetical protein [unclassified Halomonas]|uniref:hypothetical protein n=1 Tax=unclassified Halomonas TaxID=2609666 RepID=UPI000554D081|nr:MULTISPECIES: hypothetical protein [unclassified Halomonas]CEP34098.1 Putative uncharacterized protein [Halomonas sp. R57-5]